MTTDNFVMRDTRLSIVDWVCSKTQILLATLRTQNQPRGGRREEGLLCIFLMSNIRLHQLDVQEINVRVPQFYRIRNHFVGCWFENGRATWTWLMGCGDRSVSFLEDYRITNPSSSRHLFAKSQSQPKQKGNRDVDQLSHVDFVTTYANSSQGESQLCIFEENEAVIKMIIKDRSPTLRHVSRTPTELRLMG